jgi:hypothetical protein
MSSVIVCLIMALLLKLYKCLGTTLAIHNCMHEEIKSKITSENACYHFV